MDPITITLIVGLGLVAVNRVLTRSFSQGSGTGVWPVSTYRGIISPFGASRKRANGESRFHAGADLGAFPGDKVLAISDGVVLHSVSGFSLGAGLQAVAIKHSDAEYIYAEIMVAVKPGQYVRRGQVIGTVAKNGDGNSMLHIEAWTKAPKSFTEWTPSYRPAGLLDVQKMLPPPPQKKVS